MTNESFWGGVLLISGVVGFIFWPAWVVTGIVFLVLSGGTTDASHSQKKENILAPALQPRLITARTTHAVNEPNVFLLPAEKRSELPSLTEKITLDRQAKLNLWREAQSAQSILVESQSHPQAVPEVNPIPLRTHPIESLAKMRISEMAHERRIEQLIHFTRCENLGGILDRGLLSVSDLEMDRAEAIRNDLLRLEANPSAICLSVSFPNYRMFYKYRCERKEADWAVLRLSPAILWELDCLFYEMNAADHRMRHRLKSDVQDPNSFAAMFGDVGGARPSMLHPCYPTDVQAEVLVTKPIDPSYILSVAFETEESHRRWAHLTENRIVTIEGRGAGVFGARERVLAN